MHRFVRFAFIVNLSVIQMASSATAQILWLVPESDWETKVHLHFSEVEDRPELIDKLVATPAWRTSERKKSEPINLRKLGDTLSVSAEDEGLGSTYWLSQDFGISAMGGKSERVLLHAKAHTLADPSAWKAVRKSKQLPVEIIPRRESATHSFTVLSAGRPLAGATVNLVGHDSFKCTGDTDENGEVTFELPQSGMYGAWVRSVDFEQGKLNGLPFSQTVHVSTLALPLEVVPVVRLTTK